PTAYATFGEILEDSNWGAKHYLHNQKTFVMIHHNRQSRNLLKTYKQHPISHINNQTLIKKQQFKKKKQE
ncbi:5161_t:CDS:1, partial [Racocetra fulgida]